MTGEHEGKENLSSETLDLERARQSLIEELEAVNWYQERVENVDDPELREILEHNRDEEKEHVAMLVEWLRKKDEVQDMEFEDHD
ncbi:MAG: ferritin [Candidatus Aenigmatarchaeota archaeon]